MLGYKHDEDIKSFLQLPRWAISKWSRLGETSQGGLSRRGGGVSNTGRLVDVFITAWAPAVGAVHHHGDPVVWSGVEWCTG